MYFYQLISRPVHDGNTRPNAASGLYMPPSVCPRPERERPVWTGCSGTGCSLRYASTTVPLRHA